MSVRLHLHMHQAAGPQGKLIKIDIKLKNMLYVNRPMTMMTMAGTGAMTGTRTTGTTKCECVGGDNDLADICQMMKEENWRLLDRSERSRTAGLVFRKGGTDYDLIEIHPTRGDGYRVVIPMPCVTGAYSTRIKQSLDMYIFLSDFIEYYASCALDA